MNKEFYINNRKKYIESIKEHSASILFSGVVYQRSGDQDYKFSVNRNFYYLTGIDQADVILVIVKGDNNSDYKEYLLIEENDEMMAKWVGMKLTKEEAKEISGIDNILYLNSFDSLVYSLFNSSRKSSEGLTSLYLNLERRNDLEYSSKALMYSRKFKKMYPEINIENAYPKVVRLRMNKQDEEIAKMQESIDVTKGALENVLKNIKPGLYEYQVETFYDSYIKFHGQKPVSFETICAAGKNATVLHYMDNNTMIKDNELVLFDLGCCTDYYISDISRTYPANGKFTDRQKQIYEIVLKCNKECIKYLKPGLTWDEYNKYANSWLIKGLKEIGLITKDDELIKYYWHSIGHSTGLDTHDPDLRKVKFEPGMVMTVEPGLYLEEEEIGIRIEDNVLITEDGCINLSKDIIKEVSEIEDFMSKYNYTKN